MLCPSSRHGWTQKALCAPFAHLSNTTPQLPTESSVGCCSEWVLTNRVEAVVQPHEAIRAQPSCYTLSMDYWHARWLPTIPESSAWFGHCFWHDLLKLFSVHACSPSRPAVHLCWFIGTCCCPVAAAARLRTVQQWWLCLSADPRWFASSPLSISASFPALAL